MYGSNKFGDAALKNLIDRGYWKPTQNTTQTWHMDVSFRSPEDMCSKTSRSEELVGDRVVINQDTIKHNLPLTATDAMQEKWTCGSCIEVYSIHSILTSVDYGMASFL